MASYGLLEICKYFQFCALTLPQLEFHGVIQPRILIRIVATLMSMLQINRSFCSYIGVSADGLRIKIVTVLFCFFKNHLEAVESIAPDNYISAGQ